MTPFHFYIINLQGDYDRWLRINASLGRYDWIRTKRVEGVYGSALPNDVCMRLTGDPYAVIAKGAVGCLLSHVRAWELILAGEDKWAAIGEDDAVIGDLNQLQQIFLPDDVDIIFANDRTSAEDPKKGAIFDLIVNHLSTIERRNKAVGTDCYFISKIGAEKLIGLFKRDGYFGHIDMRLLSYAVEVNDLTVLEPDGWLSTGIKQLKRVSGNNRDINALAFQVPLVNHIASSETSRTREDKNGSIGARI